MTVILGDGPRDRDNRLLEVPGNSWTASKGEDVTYTPQQLLSAKSTFLKLRLAAARKIVADTEDALAALEGELALLDVTEPTRIEEQTAA